MATIRSQAAFQRKHYWHSMVDRTIGDCVTMIVLHPEGVSISGWLCYILEMLDVLMGSEETNVILADLKKSIDKRLEQGEW